MAVASTPTALIELAIACFRELVILAFVSMFYEFVIDPIFIEFYDEELEPYFEMVKDKINDIGDWWDTLWW